MLPFPNTFRLLWVTPWLSRSSFTPSPSGMTCVAHAAVRWSVNQSNGRFTPFTYGKTSPVKVCTRTGTRVNQAATMESRPAFGVMECTMSGFSFRNTRTKRMSEAKSRSGAIFRCIGTASVRTPSRRAMLSSSGSGDETTTIWYSSDNSRKSPRQKMSRESGTVAVRIIFFMNCSEVVNQAESVA